MSKNYQKLPAGKYSLESGSGLEIIKYTGGQPQQDGSVRHGLLVKAIGISKEQAEAALKAFNGASSIPEAVRAYALNPEKPEGTEFLNVVLHDHWANATGAALAFSKPKFAELKVQASPDDVKALQAALYEQAGTFLSSDQLTDGESLNEAYQGLITQIRINLGTLLRLQKLAELKPNFNPSAEQWQELTGVQFTGAVTAREGKNGKVYTSVRVLD